MSTCQILALFALAVSAISLQGCGGYCGDLDGEAKKYCDDCVEGCDKQVRFINECKEECPKQAKKQHPSFAQMSRASPVIQKQERKDLTWVNNFVVPHRSTILGGGSAPPDPPQNGFANYSLREDSERKVLGKQI